MKWYITLLIVAIIASVAILGGINCANKKKVNDVQIAIDGMKREFFLKEKAYLEDEQRLLQKNLSLMLEKKSLQTQLEEALKELTSLKTERSAEEIVEEEQIEPLTQWHTVEMNVSAYCPCKKCCGVYSNGQTANGHWIKKGEKFVAAPKTYSFMTEMKIPGYNGGEIVKVLDRGGAIKGNRLDVYFDTHQEALQFGRQYLAVQVKK